MRQAGEVLRFWISVLGLVIGLQSVCIAAGSEGSGSPDQAVEGETSPAAAPVQDAAPVAVACRRQSRMLLIGSAFWGIMDRCCHCLQLTSCYSSSRTVWISSGEFCMT